MAEDFVFEEKELPPGDHWRAFFDSRCLRHWHLGGKEMTFTITDVKLLRSVIRKQEKKQLALHFKTTDLPLVLNVTNATAIAQLYGNRPKDWVGKRITLYVTTTNGFGKETECIRVRPKKPDAKKPTREPAPAINPEPEESPIDDETPPEPGPDEPAYTDGREVMQ